MKGDKPSLVNLAIRHEPRLSSASHGSLPVEALTLAGCETAHIRELLYGSSQQS
jgi:hypothetical protein